ncbi:MAG: hypothetical protein U1F25_12240 [Rubrivivax sp.]
MSHDWKPVLAEAQQLALGNDFHCAQHFVLDVKDAAAALRFVAMLNEQGAVRFGDAPPRRKLADTALSIGFTFNALERLGLEEGCLDKLREQARGFAAGANARAAAKLGDTGPSAQDRWDSAFAAGRANVLISVHANDDGALASRVAELRALDPRRLAFDGWDEPSLLAKHLDTFDPNAPKVARLAHFGYRDGISRPRIKAMRPDPQQAWHEPGELLLGHENDAGFSLWDRRTWDDETRAFFRNATFAVFRRIEQDEPAFARFVAQAAKNEHVTEDYIKAKLCGRWPGGQLMTKAHDDEPPGDDDPVTARLHLRQRPARLRLPVRLAHPAHWPRSVRSRLRASEPLFRRGIPYGQSTSRQGEAEGIERGLMGLFFCASIEDQFETVMSEWVKKMPMGPPAAATEGSARRPARRAAIGLRHSARQRRGHSSRGSLSSHERAARSTRSSQAAKACGASLPHALRGGFIKDIQQQGRQQRGVAALAKGAPRRGRLHPRPAAPSTGRSRRTEA